MAGCLWRRFGVVNLVVAFLLLVFTNMINRIFIGDHKGSALE